MAIIPKDKWYHVITVGMLTGPLAMFLVPHAIYKDRQYVMEETNAELPKWRYYTPLALMFSRVSPSAESVSWLFIFGAGWILAVIVGFAYQRRRRGELWPGTLRGTLRGATVAASE